MEAGSRRARNESWHSYSLLFLFVFTIVAVAGYGIFALHPQMLAGMPSLARFYGISYAFFAQTHVWLTGLVLAGYLYSRAGFDWVPAFVGVYVISLTSELVGTGVGLPFGEYEYTELLGPKWFDQVPVVIPLSWFAMALPSYCLALARFSGSHQRFYRIGYAAAFLVTWDLSLDPAMSHLTGYWEWKEAGVYYGMPIVNLFGWLLTGLAITTLYEWLHIRSWVKNTSASWMRAYYLTVLAMPVGMLIAAGVWAALLVTMGVLLFLLWISRPSAVEDSGSFTNTGNESNGTDDRTYKSFDIPHAYFRHHSKSFSFAAWWFSDEEYELVTCLYAFCRTTDDIVDHHSGKPMIAEKRLAEWMDCARTSYSGNPTSLPWLDHVMKASADAGLPFTVVEDLAKGVRMDLNGIHLENEEQLDRYTYRVASVVGIWLCHLFADPDDEMLRRAAAMGRAMQLTNIVRDVGEDLENDRIYIPKTMMRRHGVSPADLQAMRNGAPISSSYESLMEELMHRADAAYSYAFRGLPALPPTFRRGAAVAAEVYRRIHQEVRRNGFDNLRQRAYTGLSQKVICAACGLRRLVRIRLSPYQSAAPHRITYARTMSKLLSRIGKGVGFMLLLIGFISGDKTRTAALPVESGRHETNARAPRANYAATNSRSVDTMLTRVRELSIRGVADEEAVDLVRALLESHLQKDPVLHAYDVASGILHTKHAFWPSTKMKYREEGLPVLDRFLEQYPDRVETRYLRLLSCYYLPGFFGRAWSVQEDFEVLARLLPAAEGQFSDELYGQMIAFVLKHGPLTTEEKGKLRAALKNDSQEGDRNPSSQSTTGS